MRFELANLLNFNEVKYLIANPDVLSGIKRGEFTSGFDHFLKFGQVEGRYQKINSVQDGSLGLVHIPKCAGTSLREELILANQKIYQGNKYSVEYNEDNRFKRLLKKKGVKLHSTTWSLEELKEARYQYDCVIGHISVLNFYKARFRDFVSIVREPRIRILSEYLFIMNLPGKRQELESSFEVKDIKGYFSNYALKYSNNVINQLLSNEVVFDWNEKEITIGCYWSDEIPKLLGEMFGKRSIGIRSNETRSKMFDIDFRILDSLHELTTLDSISIERLMRSGLLTRRSNEYLENEFRHYVKKRFRYVRRLI